MQTQSLLMKCFAVGIILLFIGTVIIPSSGHRIDYVSLPLSRGNILYVGGSGPGNYSRIQDAIDNASAGDTVFVFAGRYHEKLIVNKTINLLGENETRTIIYSEGVSYSPPVLTLLSNGIVVSNFTINITGPGSCIQFKEVSNCQISNDIIQGKYAISLGNASNNNEICYNVIQSFYGSDIGNYMDSESTFGNYVHHNHFYSSGIELCGQYTRKNIISDNFFEKFNYPAIETVDAIFNTIERNIIIGDPTKSETGIHLDWIFDPLIGGNIVRNNIIKNCSDCGIATSGGTYAHTITGNLIENCGYGLSIGCGSNTLIRNNTVRSCQVGQDIWYSEILTILEGNIYENNKEGIEVWYCRNVTFIRNTFRNDTIGISCQSSHRNLFFRNNFEGNKLDVFNLESRNRWLLNYWDYPRLLPKLIVGFFPFIQFDWRPALKPYAIGG